jgi:hypothetical protein
MMKLNKVVAIPALALAVGLGLAACGTQAPGPAATVTTPVPTMPAATTPTAAASAPQIVINNNNNQQPAPAKTVYVQAPAPPAQHAATRSTYCGEGLTAGAGTSCSFAADVARAYHAGGYWNQPGTSYFYADGQFMTSASVGNPVIVTDGSGDLVQFND